MSPTQLVDVRDMVCAQALAVVAHALGRPDDGDPLEILYNADDVKQDLLVWARDRQLVMEECGPATLRLWRGPIR